MTAGLKPYPRMKDSGFRAVTRGLDPDAPARKDRQAPYGTP